MRDPRGPAIWERFYWAAMKNNKGWKPTFRALAAYFAQENRYQWPDRSWPFMPRDPDDFYKLVEQIPMERLIQKETTSANSSL